MSEVVPTPDEVKKQAKLAKKNLKREQQGKPPIIPRPEGMCRKAWKEMGKPFSKIH
ncbi:MAG: hypothetical protein ACI96M_000412 [Candidatus Azotimanducaceae bacterium]|jgi:hypothetical protein